MSAGEPNGEVIDGTAVEIPQPGVAVIPASAPALAVTPTVQASELVDRLTVIRDAMHTAMQENVDYGKVPGTNKPTLLKPGAEKLSVLFQLDVQLSNEKVWGPGAHLTVISRATVFHAPTGSRLGYGEGICTTRERKYAYRRADRVCPTCGKPAIIRGKAEYGGGWLCFKKKDGCGAKFPDGDASIESQATGDVENPDLPDLWNTVVKMAEKRARVDAVLAVTGASALFTQDVEDAPHGQEDSYQGAPASPPPAPLPQLSDEAFKVVVQAIGSARPGTEPLRTQLVALGVENVPDGPITESTIRALTEQQAEQVVRWCGEVETAKAKA